MHLDRVPEAAAIEDEAENGLGDLEGLNEAVSEAKEFAPIELGKRKQQEGKPSG